MTHFSTACFSVLKSVLLRIARTGLCKKQFVMEGDLVDDDVVVIAEQKTLDVVVFGVTGVTGKYVASELLHSDLKWAVAGRNMNKTKAVIQEIGAPGIPVIEADVENFESLLKMCQSTKVLLNCVGPYLFYGEPVLKACLESSCHYIDISGEPQFLEKMQLLYHEEAKHSGVLVIGSCGFESIPSEMGVEFMKDNFKGQLNEVETYLTVETGFEGYTVSCGTFFTIVHCMSHVLDMQRIKRQLNRTLFTKKAPRLRHRQKKRLLFYRRDVGGWCVTAPYIDQRVASRTQRMNYELYNERPIQLRSYINASKSLFYVLLGLLATGIVFLFSTTRLGRYFLKKYPRQFTFGVFSPGGPTAEQVDGASFSLLLRGRGWDQHSPDHSATPRKTMKIRIGGPDPVYKTTAICMVQAAMVVLQEYHKMAFKGGVLTPGIAFLNTTLIERLRDSGITIQRIL